MASSISPYIDWDILTWLQKLISLPVVIKGIQCVEMPCLHMTMACKVSSFESWWSLSRHVRCPTEIFNVLRADSHSAQSPLLTLLEIRKFAPHLIHSNMQIFIDGGIRRGTDVLKAIALGATAVGLGRPFLFSMCAGYGENGVRHMVDILRQEIETNMIFLGARSLNELRPEMVNASRLERDLIGSVKL
jgi:L-lactate dehydrogenase (FMN-dependent) and related alpha-hydroxy acid dehydrogenases